MQIVRPLRETCPDTNTCPTIYLSDRQTLVVQGYVVDCPDAREGQATVRIPSSLAPEFSRRGSTVAARRVGRDALFVTGRPVTDPAALEQLQLPAGEAAVEVELVAMPELEEA